MTNSELSNEFDVLYNSITSNQAPGVDEYEKSVFLTKAQDEILKSYFDPKLNKPQEGFDQSARRQIDFSMILRTKQYNTFTQAIFDNRANSKRVTLDKDILMFINEFADVLRDNTPIRLTVDNISFLDYNRLMKKPYKRPLNYQAWRIIDNNGTDNVAEIVVGPSDTLISYTIRYLKRPRAIILSNLDDVTLDGISTEQSCELDPILHPEILQRAVELAKAAYQGDIGTMTALSSNSQTNVGAVGASIPQQQQYR